MRKKGINTGILAGTIALASLVNSVYGENIPKPVSVILVETRENGRLNVPVYSQNDVPKSFCSRYLRYAAKKLFGEKYAGATAWDLIKSERFVTNVGQNSLEQLADSGILKPGMAVMAHFPRSRFRSKEVTHAVLYLGQDKNGKGIYAHQWGQRTEVANEKGLVKYGLNFKYILDSKGGGR